MENSQLESQNTPPLPQQSDGIFVIKPPEQKTLDKKSISIVSVIAVIGGLLLVGLCLFIFVLIANNNARTYRLAAYNNLVKIEKPLKDIEPSIVLNKRELASPLGDITKQREQQPSLQSVLIGSSLSVDYKATERLEHEVKKQYVNIDTYSLHIQQLLAFDAVIVNATEQSDALLARTVTNDSLSLRSAAGTMLDYKQKINDVEIPPQLKKLQDQVMTIFTKKATLYLAWAEALDMQDNAKISSIQTQLAGKKLELVRIVNDSVYTTAFMSTYNDLVKQQRTLLQKLKQ